MSKTSRLSPSLFMSLSSRKAACQKTKVFHIKQGRIQIWWLENGDLSASDVLKKE